MMELILVNNKLLICIRYILTFIFLFFAIEPFCQKVIFENKCYEYNSIANYTDWNEYWYSGRNGFVHFHNGKKDFYLNTLRNSGVKGEWVQSDLFKDQYGFLHTSNFEYYLRFNHHDNKFVAKKVKLFGKEIESDYQIFKIDTLSNTLLTRAGDHLIRYNYLSDSIEEYICANNNLFQIVEFSNRMMVNIPHMKKNGIDIITRNGINWISKEILREFNFLKGIKSNDKLLLLSNKGIYSLDIKDLKLKKYISFNRGEIPLDFLVFNQGFIVLFKDNNIVYYDQTTNGKFQSFDNNLKSFIKLKDVFRIQLVEDQLIIGTKSNGLQFIDKNLLINCHENTMLNRTKALNKISYSSNIVYISNHKIVLPSHIHSTISNDSLVYISTESGLYIYNHRTSDMSTGLFPIKNKIIHYVLLVAKELYYITTDGNIYKNQKWLGNIGIVNHCLKRNDTHLLSSYNGLIKVSSSGISSELEGKKVFRSTFGNGDEIWTVTENGIYKIRENCSQIKYCNSNIDPASIRNIEYSEICSELVLSNPDSKYTISDSYLNLQISKPVLNINQIYLDGNPIDISTLNDIPSTYGKLEFKFTVNEKHCNDSYTCHYKIDEIGYEWIKTINDVADLSRLPFGDYTIRIKAIGSNNIAGDEIKIRFNVIPPLYRRWWFLLFTGLLLFTIGYIIRNRVLLNKLKLKQLELDKLKALQDQRDQLSQDLHDEIGSGLSKIKFLSLHYSMSGDDKIKENINNLSSSMIDSMRDMLWSLDIENDNFASLVSRLRTICRNYFIHSATQSFFEHYGDDNTMINGLIRRNIILITKEALNNVLKHANATLVTTTINCEDSFIALTIQDNGNGFIESYHDKQKAYGINGMRKRVSELNGTIMIDGENGCKITITYPL